MKKIIFYCLFLVAPLLTSKLVAQTVVPFVDFNNYFKTFDNGNFKQLEFQLIKEFKAGDGLVAYLDTRGNLRVYDGKERKDITNLNVKYEVSDHLLAYSIGATLNMWDAGKLQTLTYFAGNYVVKDSVIVFEDTRYNTVSAYWNGEVYPLYTLTGEQYMPVCIGENIIAFKDNGDFYKLFWRGKIYDIGVWNAGIEFEAGTDIICFNDPTTRTFTVFENGVFTDVEQFFLKKYKAGRGYIVYEDLNGNLMHFQNGSKNELSNFSASFWEVKDDLAIWGENSFVYAYQNNTKIRVCNFMPKDYILKNNVFAYRNILGGVSALIDQQVHDLSMQQDAEYQIYSNAVLVKLFNNSFFVFSKGRKYENF
jgi:hypothetical protein